MKSNSPPSPATLEAEPQIVAAREPGSPGSSAWNWKRTAWQIFGLAFGVRVLAVLWLNFAPLSLRPTMGIFVADATYYDEVGRNLAAGLGYTYKGDILETAALPPGFPLLLALLHALRIFSIPLVGFLNAVWGGLTALLLWDLLRTPPASTSTVPAPQDPARERVAAGRAGAERVAWLAAVGFSLYPLEIFNTPFVLKENWAIMLTVAFAWAWRRSLRGLGQPRELERRVWWGMLAGLFLGLSTLSRFPHWGLLPLFVVANGLWMLQARREPRREPNRRARPSGRAVAATVVTCLAVLSPVVWRNYGLFGQPILTPHGPARHLYFANSNLTDPESNGYYEAKGKVRAADRVDAATQNDRALQERTYAHNALRDIASKPGHVLLLVSAKLVSMWRPVWEGSSLRSWLLLGVPYVAMMLLALPGLVLSRRDSRGTRSEPLVDERTLQILVWMIGFYAVGHAVFYGMIRERQFVEPYLIVFAAYALAHLQERRAASAAGSAAGGVL